MLELRPCCEHCATLLPPDSLEARICSFECTFCRRCVELLNHVCPNCGGGFVPRPVRPITNWRNGNYLEQAPAISTVTHKPVDWNAHAQLAKAVGKTPANLR